MSAHSSASVERFIRLRASSAAGPPLPSSSVGKGAVKKQLARVHEGRREEGRRGKVRTFDNYMIRMEVWKVGKMKLKNVLI